MEPRLVERKEMRVLGIRTRTRNSNELNLKSAKIPGLWDRFYEENIKTKITHRLDPDVILGVYCSYENDYLGEYDLLVGAQVSELETEPGLSSQIILPSKYLVFKAKGQMPPGRHGHLGSRFGIIFPAGRRLTEGLTPLILEVVSRGETFGSGYLRFGSVTQRGFS